jgi:hypothetical protein
MICHWYGSSRALVVGPAATTFHRPAMVNDAPAQTESRRQRPAVMQVFVHGVAAGEQHALNGHFIAHLQFAHRFLVQRSRQRNHNSPAFLLFT